jgi:hypothetical protein
MIDIHTFKTPVNIPLRGFDFRSQIDDAEGKGASAGQVRPAHPPPVALLDIEQSSANRRSANCPRLVAQCLSASDVPLRTVIESRATRKLVWTLVQKPDCGKFAGIGTDKRASGR